jgi:uncharacterized protein
MKHSRTAVGAVVHCDVLKRVLEQTARWWCVCVLACLSVAHAYDFTSLKAEGYVSDFAGVVDQQSRTSLEQYCAALERQAGAELAFVVIRSLEGEPIEDVANALYRAWGVGKKGENNGVLLLLAVNDKRSRLEVGYGLEPVLPDGFAGSVLRAMRPALREGQYGPALLEAAHTLGGRIATAKGVDLEPHLTPMARRRHTGTQPIPWPLLMGGGMLLLWVLGSMSGPRGRGRRRHHHGIGGVLPWLLLGNMMGRGDLGGFSRGGFGGFDSGGGGFGGFGGGDSGGGGASSSW